MSDFDTLYSQYAGAMGVADEKQRTVASTAETKKAAMGAVFNPADLYKIGAGVTTGKGLDSAGQVERDARTLSPWELSVKYGPEVAKEIEAGFVQGSSDFRRDYSATRTIPEMLLDTGGSLGMSLVNGFVDIGSVGVGLADKAGLVPNGSGAYVADKIGDANEWLRSKQSQPLNARRNANAAMQGLDERDNELKFEQEKSEGSDFVASLRRIGRDSLDGLGNTLRDPMMVGDGVATGIGSLYAGGAIGKGIGTFGDAAAARLAVGAKGPSKAGFMLDRATEKLAMPVAIGALEGGGAYQQTADQAVGMGASYDAANDAGLLAGGIQAPIGALTGTLVSKFETAPTKVLSGREMIGNLIKEPIEEGIQSGTGQMSQNLGLRTYVDQSQNLSEGVGGQMAQGALFGLGTAGALQVPGAVVKGTTEFAKLAGTVAMDAKDAVLGRIDAIRAGISSRQANVATAGQDAAAAAAPDMLAGLQEDVQARGGEQAPQMAEYLTKLFTKAQFDPEEAQGEARVVQVAVQGASDRFAALRQVAQVANSPNTTEANRAELGAYLLRQFGEYDSLINEDLSDAILKIENDNPELPKLREFEATVMSLQQHPEIAAAIEKAKAVVSSKGVMSRFSETAMASDAGQQAAQDMANAVVELTWADPEAADPSVLDVIRAHSTSGRLNLTTQQKGILETASLLIRTTAAIQEQKKALGLTYRDKVTQEIQTRDEANASETVKKSAKEHAKGVLAALRVNDRDLAKTRLQDFMLFAEHMNNKVNALNTAMGRGANEPYFALSPDREPGEAVWFKNTDGLGLSLNSEGSVEFAQQTALDARAVAEMANGVAAAFLELDVQSIAPAVLTVDPKLERKATDIVKEYRQSKKAAPTNEVKSDKVAESINEDAASNREKSGLVRSATEDEMEYAADIDHADPDDPMSGVVRRARTTGMPDISQAVADIKTAIENGRPDIAGYIVDRVAGIVDATKFEGKLPPAQLVARLDADLARVKSALQETASKSATEVDPKQQPLPFEKPVEPLKEPVQPILPMAEDTEIAEESAPVEPKVAEPFADLLGSKDGKNWFKKSFNVPKTARSRIVGLGAGVIEWALSGFQSRKALENLLGYGVKRELKPEIFDAYSSLIEGIGAKVQTEMQQRLDDFVAKQGLEAVRSNELIRRRRDGKVLNLTEEVDGRLIYSPELLQGAVLAGLQWLVDGSSRKGRELTKEALSKILGIEEDLVTTDQLKAFSDSDWLPDAVQSLAGKIVQFWGVTPNPNTPVGFVKGVPEQMAKEILAGLAAAGMVNLFKIDDQGTEIPEGQRLNEGSQKSYNRVQLTKKEDIVKAMAVLNMFPGAIEELVSLDPEEDRYIGEPPKKVADTQMRNRLVKHGAQALKAIEQRQNTPHKLNTHMADFVTDLGEKLIVELFGAGKLKEDDLNVNHARSLKGTNTTVEQAYRSIVGLLGELRSKASDAGVDASDMPIFYAYNLTRVGRLQMLGSYNPQSNKLVRELVLPTRVTLDMTVPANRMKFMLAVAQAWGLKVHKQGRQTSVDEADKLSKNDYAPAMAALADALSGSKPDAKTVATLKEAFGAKLSPAAVHAAMELVRLNQSDDPSSFTTDLYVEADGVTDGPINALVHLATGAFNARWVELVAKGGLFLGMPGMTFNDYVQRGKEEKKDLYETATDHMVKGMKALRDSLKGNAVATRSMNNLLTLMDDLLGDDLKFDGENLIIERGVAKNPLTITIYGSGLKGIAGNVAEELLGKFYEELSKAAQGKSNKAEKIRDLIEDLSSVVVRKSKKKFFIKNLSAKTKPAKDRDSLNGYTLSRDQVKNLEENVLNLFVRPLNEAITDTVADTVQGRDLVQKATQAQSIVLKHEFHRLIEERIKAREEADPDYHRSHFLSQNDFDKIYTELEKTSPLVKSGGQILFISGSENSDIETTEFSQSLKGDMSTPARIYGPKNAGVSGIPFLVISTGDGQMMLNLFTGEQVPSGALDVFDGVHLKIDTLEEDSVTVNKSVYDGWLNNPIAAINESYQVFIDNLELATGNRELMQELSEAFEGGDPLSELHLLKDRLIKASDRSEARHRALARVAMTVDHMASAESPYEAGGESLEKMKPAQIAERLNALAREEYGKIIAKREAEAADEKQVLDESAELLDGYMKKRAAKKADALGPEKDMLVLDRTGLQRLVGRMKLPAEQRNLLKEAIRALGSGWEIVRGTQEQTTAYALSKNQEPYTGGPGDTIKGCVSLAQKRIYLNTEDPETLLHELLHASVTAKIVNHYAGKTTPEVSQAVANLEELMAQWMEQEEDLSGLTAEQRLAYRDALRQVNAELSNPGRIRSQNQAAALDEFLAWNLSNQELIKIAQQTEVRNPLVRVVKRALVALKNLIWGRNNGPMVRSDMYSALRFNASVLINATPTLQSRAVDVSRAQSVGYGNSDRLTALHQMLSRKLYSVLGELPPLDKELAERKLATQLGGISRAFIDNTFSMSTQEKAAFDMLLTVFATTAKLDSGALGRVQELYAHVNKTLKVEDFMADPGSQDPAERYAAQQKFSVLKGIDYASGRSIVGKDDRGVSTLMSAFLALSMVNEDFQAVLSKIDLPKNDREPNNTLDNRLTNIGNTLIDGMSRTLSGERRGRQNVQEALDDLTARLADNLENQENVIGRAYDPVRDAIAGFEEKVVGAMQKGSKAVIGKLTEVQDQTSNKAAQGVLEALKGIAAVVNAEEASLLAEGLMSTVDRLKIYRPLHDLLNDLVGRTESNAPIFDMIKKVRSVVQQVRQQFREHLPGMIAKQFGRELSKQEWGHLFKGLAKADLAALKQSFSVKEILRLIANPAAQAREIKRLEDLIEADVGSGNWRLMQAKAQQLAVFMNTGVPGHHLLRNAQAVSKLMGVIGATPYSSSSVLTNRVDQLVSLYALSTLDQSVKDSLVSLVQTEDKGMTFALSYLAGLRTAEQNKVTSGKAQANHYKGYIPSLPAAGAQMLVAKNSEEARLRLLG